MSTYTQTRTHATRHAPHPAPRTTYPSERHSKMYTRYHDLKPMAFKVFAAIKELAFDGETRTLDLFGIAQIAQCSVASVSAALPQIVAAGYIRVYRAKAGRGHCYTITVIAPEAWPQSHAPAPGAFFGPAERPENDQHNVQPADVSAVPVSSIPITQTRAACAPSDQQTHRFKQQQRFDGGAAIDVRTAEFSPEALNGADDQLTQLPPIAPATELMSSYTPDQHALFLRLRREYAEAVAAQMVAINPTRTVADFACDLRAAESRPNVFAPLGLVCDAWLRGSRVTPARSRVPPDDAPAPDAPVTDAPDTPAPRGAKRRPSSRAAPEPPTATQQMLLEAGFNPTTAREFRACDEATVAAILTRALTGVMSATERNRVIGRLVVRWRNEGLAAPSEGGHAHHEEREEAEEQAVREGHDGAGYAARDECGGQADPVDPVARDECGGQANPVDPAARDEPKDEAPESNGAGIPAPAVPAPPDALWAAVQAHVRGMVGVPLFAQEIAEVRLMRFSAEHIELGCPSLAYRERLENRHMRLLRQAWCAVLGVPEVWLTVVLYRPQGG